MNFVIHVKILGNFGTSVASKRESLGQYFNPLQTRYSGLCMTSIEFCTNKVFLNDT